jgi:hypothetical protein
MCDVLKREEILDFVVDMRNMGYVVHTALLDT